MSKPTGDDVTPSRQERRADAVKAFEEARNQAQYQAAIARWELGDAVGCQTLLQQILQRRPDDREARLALADLHLENNEPELARGELARLLQQFPDDAQVRHSMGLWAEAVGRRDEAADHFAQAARLDPDNRLYALSLETATQGPPAPIVHDRPTARDPRADAPDQPQVFYLSDAESTVHPTAVEAMPAAPPAPAQSVQPAPSEQDQAAVRQTVSATVDTSDAVINRAVRLIQSDEALQAVQLLGEFPPSAEHQARYYRILGAAQFQRGAYRAAQVALEQALSLDSAHPLTYFLMGSCLTADGEPEAARPYFEAARRLDGRLEQLR